MDEFQPEDFEDLVSRLNLDPSLYTRPPPDWASTDTPLSRSADDNHALEPAFIPSDPPTVSIFRATNMPEPARAGTNRPDSPRPVSVLSTSSSSQPRRIARFNEDSLVMVRGSSTIHRVEKDADDPTTSSDPQNGLERRDSTTALTRLSRLFAAQAVTSPTWSRTPSHTGAQGSNLYMRSLVTDPASLSHHLYTRGLLNGRHSDIHVNAFGHRYRLHRLILDRSPFFATALSEPWLESNEKEITLHPEDVDCCLTQTAFELALKRLYGCNSESEEEGHARDLLATGCWLEMQDLVDFSVDTLLRQLSTRTIAAMIRLVTSNYYGKAGERILASAKAMLCRDGWEMPFKYWDGIPGEIVREIVGGDGFFVEGEWDRWILCKRLLDRRLKASAIAAGIFKTKAPRTLRMMAVRFDSVYRKNAVISAGEVPDSHHQWLALYTHPDVEPLLVLIDEGIHYMHMSFEQLQFIREERDILGLPVMSESVINNALWMGMELRQKVLSARESDLELGVSEVSEVVDIATPRSSTEKSLERLTSPAGSAEKGKEKMMEDMGETDEEEEEEEEEEDMDSGSWDGNGKPRKFWIPSTDCNVVMGGNVDVSPPSLRQPPSRLSASLQPEDVQWATDFAVATSDRPATPARPGSASGGVRPPSYSHYPPFRFAAELPNPKLLKEKKRVYSRTVFYAGSLWNIYIQKVRSSKNPQLGVYLHRAKEREAEEAVSLLTRTAHGSVDDRIGQLERDILLRNQQRAQRDANDEPIRDLTDDTSLSGADLDIALVDGSSPALSRHDHARRRRQRRASHGDSLLLSLNAAASGPALTGDNVSDGPSSLPAYATKPDQHRRRPATLPAYVDARPTIKTYFKIYSPSRGGRMLSVYESAPDKFNFSQSWGWKSSTLMLEDGIAGEEGEREREGQDAGAGEGNAGGARREGRLRFMVVIGNV